MNPRQIAQRLAKHYREDPSRWVKGSYGRFAPNGCCCVIGGARGIVGYEAAYQHGGEAFETALREVGAFKIALIKDAALPRLNGTSHIIIKWQDAPERTVVEVIDALEKVA